MPDNKLTKEDLLKLEADARWLAQLVGPMFEQAGAAFAVIGFEFGDGGWSTWISNAQQGDMVKALREMADALERDEDIPPTRPGGPEA